MIASLRSRSRVTALILVATLAGSPLLAQTGSFCPIIPQTKPQRVYTPAGGGRFITLAGAIPDSVQYRLRYATEKDLVLVDAESLKSERARNGLKSSRAQVVLTTDRAPDAVARLLSVRVANAETIAAIPASGLGVESMYGLKGDAQQRALRHFQERVEKPLAALPNTSVVTERTPTGGATIADLVQRKARTGSPDKPLVVVGHNENGVLLFPDNSKLEIARIQSLGTSNQRPVLVLSCETMAGVAAPGLATTRRFGFDEIASALSVATKRTAQTPDAQLGTLIQELNVGLNQNSGKSGRFIRIAFAVVGSGLIIVAVLLLLDDDEGRSGRHQ